LSWFAFAPKGQQLSPFAASTIGSKLQRMPQRLGVSPFRVQGMRSSHCDICVGHKPSQNSPRSTTLLPQRGSQSLSLFALPRSGGQQPSRLIVCVIATCAQATLQLLAEPVGKSWVQGFPSSQDIAQGSSALPGSQSSPAAISTTPLPQLAEQSLSLSCEQLAGQQLSPPMQASIGCMTQMAVQLAASPSIVALRHALAPAQDPAVGQVSIGSQVSSASRIPLPHRAAQSMSLLASVPAGQQPSPDIALWIRYPMQRV
jgi:hypothetical protein